VRLGSGALGLAYAAAGCVDAYWERHMNSWDAAAGLILAREAGGSTNDFLAGDGLAVGGEVLAATPALFEPLKRLIAFGPPR
jgi:myo-inositol-1(or 4)-monophosphatase